MTYAEFLARPASVNDAECAEIVMRWTRRKGFSDSVWFDKNGLAMTDRFHPTTDRNDTAMLVEKATEYGRYFPLAKILLDAFGFDDTTTPAVAALWGVSAAPSLVAWACCEACRE